MAAIIQQSVQQTRALSNTRLAPIVSLLCALFVSLGFIGRPAWAGGNPEHHVRVVQSFEPIRNNGTPLVQVRFSNTVIGTFLIDTGSFECLMTDRFARRLGVTPKEYSPFGFLLTHSVFVYPYTQIPEIKLSNLTVTGQRFRVVPEEEIAVAGPRRIDGILGADLLARFAVLIDYPNHEISWITPGNLGDGSLAELGFTPQEAITLDQDQSPLDNSRVNSYSTRVRLRSAEKTGEKADGKMGEEKLYVDTGSPYTLISYSLARKLNLIPGKTELTRTLFLPLAQVSTCRVPILQAGGFTATDVPVLFPAEKHSYLPSLLGEDILSGCVALFDFGPHRLYLRPVLPPLVAPPAPVDSGQVNWDRLRRAPDLPTVEECLATGFFPQTSPPDKSADTLQAEVQAHPEDGETVLRWVTALVREDREEEAVTAARQASSHLPSSAPVWRSLGLALATHALRLLAGPGHRVTEDQALAPYPAGKASSSDVVQTQPIGTELHEAQTAFDKAVALAPQDPVCCEDRAVFWVLDRGVQILARKQGIKLETFPDETTLALCLADLQQSAFLSPSDPDRLRRTALLDLAFPAFHDRKWLETHLTKTGRTVPATLSTHQTAQARLAALAQDPDKARAASALAALGSVQAAQGDTGADDSFRRALALDPGQINALEALALRLHDGDHWTELRDLLVQQSARKDTVPLRLMLAAMLNATDQVDGAETQVRSALKLDPANAAANLALAELLLAHGGADKSVLAEVDACLGRAEAGWGARATPEQKATLATARAVWTALTGDPDKAEKQLVALVKDQPTCTQAREALAAMTVPADAP